MLRVFFILCFCVWFGVFCRFFTVLLFLGSLFEKIFRERTFVFGCCCWSCVFLVGFCLCFCFMFWRVAPESVWKNSLDVRSVVLKKFSGANFCFWASLLVLCFLVGFCFCFCFMFWRVAPESVWKNSLDVRSAVLKNFSGANFCFLGVGVGHVFVGAVLLMFLLYVLAVRSRSCLEKFS